MDTAKLITPGEAEVLAAVAQPKAQPKAKTKEAKTLRIKGPKDLLDRVVSKINAARPKKAGGPTFDVVRSSESILSAVKYVVRTGIDPLDDICGGFPIGRVTEIFGTEGCGKSATCVLTAIVAQKKEIYEVVHDEDTGEITYKKLDPDRIVVTVLYIDNEQSVDDDGKVEIDGTQLDCALSRCDTVQHMFKIIDTTVDLIAEVQEAENKKAKTEKREPLIHFIIAITDTVAATSSTEDMAKEWDGGRDFPRVPQVLKDGFRTLTRKINRYNVGGIFTNQVGDNFGQVRKLGRGNVVHADDVMPPGGRALRFYASLRVFATQITDKYKLYKGQQFSAGLLIKLYTKKNRQLKPLREARMVLLFNGGLSNMYSILETLVFLKFATVNDDGKITLRYSRAGIANPNASPEDLEKEDDGEAREEAGPEIENRAHWPAFYTANKADVTKLYKAAIAYMFDQSGEVGADMIDLDEEDEVE